LHLPVERLRHPKLELNSISNHKRHNVDEWYTPRGTPPPHVWFATELRYIIAAFKKWSSMCSVPKEIHIWRARAPQGPPTQALDREGGQ
jgi:hypothetical protein